jgi:hypothetical protein
MSFTVNPSSSAPKKRRTHAGWGKTPPGATAKSRLKYVDTCVQYILSKATDNATPPRCYYSPYRPEDCRKSKTRASDVPVCSGYQRDWLPCHRDVSISCSFCKENVRNADFGRCIVMKNAYAHQSWSFLCPGCSTKM